MTVGHETMQKLALWTVALCAAGALLTACADTASLPEAKKSPATTTTWTSLTAPGGALAACSGCHGTSSPAAGLSITAGGYSTLFTTNSKNCPGDKFVTKGDGTKSSLYEVILPTGNCKVSAMTSFQSASLAAEIGDWIDAGAPQ